MFVSVTYHMMFTAVNTEKNAKAELKAPSKIIMDVFSSELVRWFRAMNRCTTINALVAP